MNYPTLAQLLESAADLRPLSGTATKVLALSEGQTFSAQQLAEVIVSEPALATRMLRIANSAFYGAPRRIASIREAIVLIGFSTVHSTVMAMCLIDACPRTRDIDGMHFWRHSVSVATLAEGLAKQWGAKPDHAFSAGIVHNIGRLALAQFAPSAFRAALAQARTRGISLHEAEHELLGYTDAAFGAALAERWRFPESLAEAIEGCDLTTPPRTGPVARAVREARGVVASLGVTDGVDAPLVDARPERAPEEWAALTRRVDAFLAHVAPV